MRLLTPAVLAAACLVLLPACSPTPPATPATPAAAAQAAPETAAGGHAQQQLPRHVWHLRDAKDADGAPVTALLDTPGRMLALRFDEGRIALLNGCNHMGGRVRIDADAITVSELASTMMACADSRLMDFDNAAARLLEGRLGMQLGSGDSPALTLTTAAGDELLFEGEPTDETRYGGPGQQVFLEVDFEPQPCPHPLIPDKQCLQVREIAYDDRGIRTGTPGPYQHFYDTIQGYEHTPGTRQVLRVKRFDVPNPPADASRHAWVLDTVVETEDAR